MIAFLKGLLCSVDQDSVVLDVNGVGYQIQVPLPMLANLPAVGSEMLLYTYMVLREDGVSLYGFDDVEYLRYFKMLLGVNGVGPKGALSLLSSVTPDGLAMAVNEGNAGLISKAPGIGMKTAQRIILELKDKLKTGLAGNILPGSMTGINNDAIEALISLGFDSTQSVNYVNNAVNVLGSDAPLTEVVRYALKMAAQKNSVC